MSIWLSSSKMTRMPMKVLSMTDRRLQDRIDAQRLVAVRSDIRLDIVRSRLELITLRGFHRNQDLSAKLDSLLRNEE